MTTPTIIQVAERAIELSRLATPGPWHSVNVGDDEEPMMDVKAARIAGQPPRHTVASCCTGDSPQAMEDANAEFIASSRESLPLLAKAVIALSEENARLREALKDWIKTCECHGTGIITRCDWASTTDPIQMNTRECHADYCKAARKALASIGEGGGG